jgi:hypothetical protein
MQCNPNSLFLTNSRLMQAKMPLEYDAIVRKMFGNEEEGF